MVAGHLREQNGYYQMILSWKDSFGKRKTKSISTGLAVKGNKKRAEAMLQKARQEFDTESFSENAEMSFEEFLKKWLRDISVKKSAAEYADCAYQVKAIISPYFHLNPVNVANLGEKDLEAFFQNERLNDDAVPEDLLGYHGTILACLDYAVELGWILENPALKVNPCADQAPILFADFIGEWLELMRSKVKETTFASYQTNVAHSIIPYFAERKYTLQDLEKHPIYIQNYYSSLMKNGTSPTTVIRRHANIRKCLQYAFQIGLIRSNPADRVEKPRKAQYKAVIYNQEELTTLFNVSKGDPLELAIILGAFYGLRRSEVAGLRWDAIDFEKKTISIQHTVVDVTIDGEYRIVSRDTTKTKSSCRKLPLVPPFERLLLQLREQRKENRRVCGNCYNRDYLDYIYVDGMGNRIKPNFITQHFELLLQKNKLKKSGSMIFGIAAPVCSMQTE